MSRLVAFWSPSGAGATTLALNVSAAAGARGVRLAAADLNLTAPSLALYGDLLPHDRPGDACLSRLLPALSGGRLGWDELSRLLIPGPGFMLLPGMLDVLGASRLTEAHIRQLLRMLRSRFDLVIADLSAPMDSIACLPALEEADLILLVVGPEIASRLHTRRFALPLRGMGWDARVALIYNRAGSAPVGQVARDVGLPVAAEVPCLSTMPDLIEAGRIAYDAGAVLKGTAKFRVAIDGLASLVLKFSPAATADAEQP